MNLNDVLSYKTRGRCRKSRRPNTEINNAMGPPIKQTQNRRDSTNSTVNWGKSTTSILNASSLLRSEGSAKSSETESRVIVEGRGDARCEVGLAALNITRSTLILCQISDSQSYINALTKINIFNPHEVIFPKTFSDNFQGNRLTDKMKSYFTRTKFTSVPRHGFNKNRGIERIQELCIPSMDSILLILKHKYYALSAAAALLFHANSNLNVYYASGSLKIDYQESEGYAFVDVSTADRLELVSSTRPEQATKYSSLFGVLNRCYTKIGARTLRSAILQPLCKLEKIEEHLNCVTELTKSSENLISIQEILQKIPNIDHLLTISTIMPEDAQSCSNRQLNYILLLNNLLDLISPLKDVLKTSQQKFFCELAEFLNSEVFVVMKTKVRDFIHDEAHPATGPCGIYQRCFAIKAGVNGLLDFVRNTYSERIEEMREYVKGLAEKYNLPLTLSNNSTKGYHIVMTLNKAQKRTMKKSDIPQEFIQVYRLSGCFTMKTAALMNLSTRIEDILMDVLKISNVMVYQIILELKENIPVFHRLCEDIAHLDMLQSLAEASVGYSYVRPKFASYTEITQAHHPLLDFLSSTKPVANNISASKDHNVHIITGPSGSGKSIFIRQVMLLQVMAQLGCYVPAESATFRVADRMFTRIYLEDDMEFGVSSFVLEMKEIKYILNTMTPRSLIIVDELCRSTSLEEGMALAMAICEKLARSSAFLYITTHFTTLAKIYDMYLNVKVWQMETMASGDSPQTTVLDFRYNLMPGITQVQHYGVYMVRNVWPDHVLRLIEEALANLKVRFNRDLDTLKVDERIRLKYDLECKLRYLKDQGRLTRAEINKNLNAFQNKIDNIKYAVHIPMPNVGRHFLDSSVTTCNVVEEEVDKLVMEENCNLDEEGTNLDVVDNLVEECAERILQNFTPDVTGQSVDNYIGISHYLNEHPEGIDMFIPEVQLSCENSQSEISEFEFAQPLLKDFTKTSTPVIKRKIEEPSLHEELEICSQILSKCGSFEEEDTSTIEDDLKVCSQVFSKRDSFEDDYKPDNHYQGYLYPKVVVLEGPNVLTMPIQDTASSSGYKIEVMEDKAKFCISTSSKTNDISSKEYDYKPGNHYQGYLSPKVVVLEGPNDLTMPLQDTTSSSGYKMEVIEDKAKFSISTSSKTNDSSSKEDDKTSGYKIEAVEDKAKFSISTSSKTNDSSSKEEEKPKVLTKKFGPSALSGSSSAIVAPPKPRRFKSKFVPPRKLTTKAIRAEFQEQDKKLLETDVFNTSEYSKHLQQFMNRPTIQQLKNQTHLATIRKTEQGVEVIPGKAEKPRQTKFSRKWSSDCFDVTIFSDKNAKPFEDFLASKEMDMKRFNFGNTEGVPTQGSASSYIPSGYYKHNKDEINKILDKYLTSNSSDSPNIFRSNSICDLSLS